VLSLLTAFQIVSQFAAAAQAACSTPLNFAVGSVLLSIAQANASVYQWLQWLIVIVAGKTRASTSYGADLDTWLFQFNGFTRNAAVASSGQVQYFRNTATQPAVIPLVDSNGYPVVVQTEGGTATFQVIADTTNSLWSASLQAYVIPAGTQTGLVSVQAQTAGSGGNVLANTITFMGTDIPYTDTVTNPSAFTNGVDAETDVAVRARFGLFISSLERGTPLSLQYAAQSVQANVVAEVQQNTPANGFSTVTIDDGSGDPPGSLISACQAAVNAYTAAGTVSYVVGPTKVVANIEMTLTVPAGSESSTYEPDIAAALATFINALPVGAALPYSRIAQIAYDAAPAILNVTNITLNAGTIDLPAVAGTVYRAGTTVVS
jgi:uncharacterized phage protein gp47/JayE